MAHVKVKNMISTSDPRVCLIGHPAPAWMVNYADLMTELVCFFIVLYALSAALNKDVQKAKEEVQEAMKQEQVKTEVKVTKEGMQITIQEAGENVFFQSGSADLSPRMEEILDKLAPPLKKLADEGHDIVVEGHTDNIPIRNARFPSNWELSTARATSVVQSLINVDKFPPQHMGAIGYGQFKPLVPNDTPENRSMNRRVVFFVKNKPPSTDLDKEKDKAKKKKPEAAGVAIQSIDALGGGESDEDDSAQSEAQKELPLPVQPADN